MKSPDVTVPDPACGLPLKRAMTFYGNQEAARAYGALVIRDLLRRGTINSLSDQERLALASYRLALLEDQLLRLREGIEYATGFRAGSVEPITIPAAWWQAATVDIDENTADAHGTRLSGILVFDVVSPSRADQPATGPVQPNERRRGRRPVERTRVANLMRDDIRSGRRTLEDLRAEKVEVLPLVYNTSRATAEAALLEIVGNSISDN